MSARTLLDKVWDLHVVEDLGDGMQLMFVDRHVVHELSGHRGHAEMAKRGLKMRNPELSLGSMDHVVSTAPGSRGGNTPNADRIIEAFRTESRRHGMKVYDIGEDGQGIVHVIGPELGFTIPGTLLVCGDSHTCTHGALGALAWGIGTTELVHVLATQTVVQQKPKTMRVDFRGTPARGVTREGPDPRAHRQARHRRRHGLRSRVRGRGDPRPGHGRPHDRVQPVHRARRQGRHGGARREDLCLPRRPAPRAEGRAWEQAVAHWRTLPTDAGAKFDREEALDCAALAPQITWGTSPEDVIGVDGTIPGHKPDALAYMGLAAGKPIAGTKVDRVFIGSCTNSRLPDLRAAAAVVKGRKAAKHVKAWVVPGSWRIKQDAEAEGLHEVFRAAGFEWREAGCSMCVAANGDYVEPLARCVSTSNRNFVGRQGPQARTHLASPAMAAAAAIAGEIADVRTF